MAKDQDHASEGDAARLQFPDESAVQFRTLDVVAVEAELRLKAKDIERKIDKIEEAQSVRQEVLQLEFRV